MWCARCGKSQVRVGKVARGETNIMKQEERMMDILKTVTWREALDMLLGITSILCFMIGLVLALGV